MVVHGHEDLALARLHHDRLAVQTAHHVERALRLAAKRQLQHVFADAALDDAAQFVLHLEVAVRGAQPADALVRTAVVVVLDPKPQPFPCLLETVELGTGEELAEKRLPKPLDLAEGHGVMRTALEVMNAVLLQLFFEPRGTAPVGKLPPVVGQHLTRNAKLAHAATIDLQHMLGGLTAEQVAAGQETAVIVHVADHVGVLAAQAKREDVGLPHLVRCGTLEEAGFARVALGLGLRLLDQIMLVQRLAHRVRAGRQEQHAFEHLRDALRSEPGALLLDLDYLVFDRCRNATLTGLARFGLERCLTVLAVGTCPFVDGMRGASHLVRHQFGSVSFFDVELNCA